MSSSSSSAIRLPSLCDWEPIKTQSSSQASQKTLSILERLPKALLGNIGQYLDTSDTLNTLHTARLFPLNKTTLLQGHNKMISTFVRQRDISALDEKNKTALKKIGLSITKLDHKKVVVTEEKMKSLAVFFPHLRQFQSHTSNITDTLA